MKSLTEALETTARSEGCSSTRGETTAATTSVAGGEGGGIHESETYGGERSESRDTSHFEDRIHGSMPTVTVSVSSTSGFDDSEIFLLPDAKTAKAFARRVMTACLRAYERRNGNSE